MTDVDRLFHTYRAALVRYLTRRLGDRDWAEDLAHETFLRAMRHTARHALAPERERSWLFAVATNLVRDEARRDARRRRHLELLRAEADGARAESPAGVYEDAQERAREAALARRAVDALAERDRLALLMREEGLEYPEIAAALGLSVGSIGTTLARARRRLVEQYEALAGAEGRTRAS